MSKSKFNSIATFLIIFGFIGYILFQVLSSNIPSYKAIEAVETTVNDTISAHGLIIRDEQYVLSDLSGAVSYELSDGEAVEKGGTIANFFPSESDAVNYRAAKSLETVIADLKNINERKNTAASDINTIDNSIENKIIDFLSAKNSHSYRELDSIQSSLISSINERRFITGKETDYQTRISQLEGQLAQINSISATGAVKASEAGYFSSVCDGYESLNLYDNILDLTLSELRSLSASSVPSNCVGKIIRNYRWYIVAEISADDVLRLKQTGTELTVSIPFAVNREIPVTVEKINQESIDGSAVLILSCDILNEDLARIRYEPVEVNIKTYSGLRIPKIALHDAVVNADENGEGGVMVQGVYVLEGQEVEFKEVLVVYSGSDYILSKKSPDEDDVLITGEAVALYDNVITQGDDIYDGKIIE